MDSLFQFQFLCFLSLVILIYLGQVSSQPSYRYHYCKGANYKNNTQFQHNLNLTLSSISSKIISDKIFYNNSIGENPDRVYSILLCKGDLTDEACKTCAETAAADVIQRCPNKKEYISWYDDCMLRYSDKNIVSVMRVKPGISLYNNNRVKNPELFYKLVSELMDSLVKKVAVPNGDLSSKRFISGELNAQNFSVYQKLYGFVQCSPDISASDCNRCLRGAMGNIPSCCFGRPGGRVLRPSCHIRFEVYPFYKSTDSLLSSPPPSTDGKVKKSNLIVVFIVLLASFTAFILAIIIFVRSQKKRQWERINCMETLTEKGENL